jgi:Zn-dependent protease with chaperone function
MADTLNFFQAQDDARGRTTLLVALLTFASILLALSPFVVFMVVWQFRVPQHVSWYQPEIFLCTTIPMVFIILIGNLVRMTALAKGSCAIAGQMGAKLVSAQTAIPAEKAYLNVVEEMALAAGLPVPSCFVFAEDRTINAFAAADGPQDAAIAVTQGALTYLTRDELQGVIAYVMGHIGNGDTKLSIRFIGVAGGLTAIAELGKGITGAGGAVAGGGANLLGHLPLPSGKDGAVGCLVVIAVVLAIIVLLVFAGLFLSVGAAIGLSATYAIQAAVWRQRESLSDAAAVQFTRNPAGLASALKKVAVRGSAVRSAARLGTEWQNFFFTPMQGVVANSASLRSSIGDRIKFIDPTFNGVIPDLPPVIAEAIPPPLPKIVGAAAPQIFADGGVLVADKQIRAAFGFGGALPPDLRTAAADPVGAMGIVLGLILRQDPALRTEQLAQAQGLAGGQVVKEALKHEASLRALPAGHRVPLLDVAMPALRQLSAAQVAEFGQAIDQVGCQADDGLLILLIHASMHRYLSVAPKRMGKVGDLGAPFALILSAVVQTSGEGADAQAAAYLKGAKALGMKHVSQVMIPAEQVDLAEVESALGVIADKSVIDLVRRKLVNACCVAMLSDGKAEPAEVEIIRAVADTLGVSLTAA